MPEIRFATSPFRNPHQCRDGEALSSCSFSPFFCRRLRLRFRRLARQRPEETVAKDCRMAGMSLLIFVVVCKQVFKKAVGRICGAAGGGPTIRYISFPPAGLSLWRLVF